MRRILPHIPAIPLLCGALALALSSCAGSKASIPAESDIPTAIEKLPPETRRSIAKDAFLEALWLELQGQDLMATDYLQEAAWNDPDDRWLHFTLAAKLREFRRSADALALARRAMTLPGEESSDQWGLLAGLWLEAGAKDSARACWERMLVLEPRAREALVGLAMLAESRGDHVEAATRYSALSEDYGDAARAIVARAVALWMRAGRNDSATALLARRWSTWHDPEEGESLARLLSTRGLPDSAVALYDSLASDPDAEASRLHLMAARAWMLNGRLDSARIRLEALSIQGFSEARLTLGAVLLDLDSINESRRLFLPEIDDADHGALACHYLGLVALRKDQLDTARIWFDAALQRDPQRPDTWARRGLLELDAEQPDSAVRIFERMTRLWPSSAQARWLRAHALARQAEKQSTRPSWEAPSPDAEPAISSLRREAIIQLDTALQLDPGQPRARFERAALFERLGLRDSAFQLFRIVVRDNPEDPVAANYLAYMLAEDSLQIDVADSLVSAAIATDSVNPAYLDTRSWIRYRQGRYAEALADVDSSIATGEDDPVVLEHRACILGRMGRTEEERKAWEELLTKAPGHPRALRALGRNP